MLSFCVAKHLVLYHHLDFVWHLLYVCFMIYLCVLFVCFSLLLFSILYPPCSLRDDCVHCTPPTHQQKKHTPFDSSPLRLSIFRRKSPLSQTPKPNHIHQHQHTIPGPDTNKTTNITPFLDRIQVYVRLAQRLPRHASCRRLDHYYPVHRRHPAPTNVHCIHRNFLPFRR